MSWRPWIPKKPGSPEEKSDPFFNPQQGEDLAALKAEAEAYNRANPPQSMESVLETIRNVLSEGGSIMYDEAPLELTEDMRVSDPVTPAVNVAPVRSMGAAPSPPRSETFTFTRVYNGWIGVCINDSGQKIGKAFVAAHPDQLAEYARTWGVNTQDM